MIPYQPKDIILDFVTSLPFYDGRVLGRVLDVLCAHRLLTPTKTGWDERMLDPFELKAFDRSPGRPVADMEIFARTKKLKYMALVDIGWTPRLKMAFDPKTPSKDWSTVFGYSDELAAVCEPEMGWLHMAARVTLPSPSPSDALQEVMDLSTDGHKSDWKHYGPRGLGMRTYIGPLLIEQIGRPLLLSLPVPTTELPWGGVRIDLCEKPWEATQERLHEAWLAAMHHLRPCGVFATYEVHPNGAVTWTRGPKLVNQGGKAP